MLWSSVFLTQEWKRMALNAFTEEINFEEQSFLGWSNRGEVMKAVNV